MRHSRARTKPRVTGISEQVNQVVPLVSRKCKEYEYAENHRVLKRSQIDIQLYSNDYALTHSHDIPTSHHPCNYHTKYQNPRPLSPIILFLSFTTRVGRDCPLQNRWRRGTYSKYILGAGVVYIL